MAYVARLLDYWSIPREPLSAQPLIRPKGHDKCNSSSDELRVQYHVLQSLLGNDTMLFEELV